MVKPIPWSWFDHRTDVPRWLAAGVGQIAIEWSTLERELEEIIRLLADVDIRQGRMFTTGMNMRTRLKTATSFLQDHVYRNKLKPKILDDFLKLSKDVSEKIEGDRNLMVHGLWGCVKGEWRVLQNTGSRQIPQLQPDIKSLARAVIPQSKPVTAKSLELTAQKIVAAVTRVVEFHGRIESELVLLQHKSPEYTRRHHQPRAHTKKALPNPPRS